MNYASPQGWSGSERQGAGAVETGASAIEFPVPASRGGRGTGTNPEELVASAVGSCYTATLASLPFKARLP
ncbi:MAG: hypothetical protein DLM67_04745 [Candidatus Nephthysia bennettiae]|nr:MAG: hypothetical protein DLM67_04745 [Candidatus Dormibacteraeota bacterium]